MQPRTGLPEVWPSGLAKYLAGSLSCGYQVWLKAHAKKYAKVPSDFDSAAWKVKHTALLAATRQRYNRDGWKITVEDQNRFRLEGQTCVLSGKPDLVCRRGKEIRVVDVKTGEPREEHAVQVAIYAVALPLVWRRPGLYVSGEVAYADHEVAVGPEQAEALSARLFATLRELADPKPWAAVPSELGCRWCDVSASECPDRMDAGSETGTVATELF